MITASSPILNSAGPDRPGSGEAATLVPIAPRVDQADGERDRALDYLRRKLAEGKLSPSRKRLMEQELKMLEAA